jgi:hypothetical protein
VAAGLGGQIEGIGVLHQEFARAHHAEARADLVAELPLNMEEIERQILIGAHRGAKNLGDHLLIGRAIEHLAVMAVGDAQHFLAIGVIASRLAPQIGGLNGRHQTFDGPGAGLLLADDGVDLVQDPQPERQPGVDAGRLLPDHARPQHQPVRDDFRLFRGLAQNRQKIAGKAHVGSNWAIRERRA